LANSALAIRIIFPSVRVIQVSFNLTGLPASLGKQKSPATQAGQETHSTWNTHFAENTLICFQSLHFISPQLFRLVHPHRNFLTFIFISQFNPTKAQSFRLYKMPS
jgi:hypothetical protein